MIEQYLQLTRCRLGFRVGFSWVEIVVVVVAFVAVGIVVVVVVVAIVAAGIVQLPIKGGGRSVQPSERPPQNLS